MASFLRAALPWIFIGISIAIIAVHHFKNRETNNGKKDKDNRMNEGMCIGMCLGVVLGTSGVCEIATGISMGMFLGMVIGMYIKK